MECARGVCVRARRLEKNARGCLRAGGGWGWGRDGEGEGGGRLDLAPDRLRGWLGGHPPTLRHWKSVLGGEAAVAAARARHPSLPMRRPLSAKPVNSLPNVLSPSPPPAGHPSLAPPVAKPIDGDDEDGEDDDPPSGEEEFDEEVRGWRKKRKRKKTRDSNPLSIFQAATATVGRETQHARATGGGAPFHPHTPRHTQVDDPASGGEEEDDNPSGDEEAGDPAGGAPADDDPEDEEDEEEDFDEEEDDFTEEEDDEEDVSYFVHPERRAGGAVHVCTRPRKAAENGCLVLGAPGSSGGFLSSFLHTLGSPSFFHSPTPSHPTGLR